MRDAESGTDDSGEVRTPRTRRFESLDGLRGLAALVVVFHHASLTLPAISDVYLVAGTAPPQIGTALWWLTSTPVQLLVAGPQAVFVFFVLSGFVLVLPVLNNVSFDWVAYYPRRLARLYLPAIASVALAAAWIQLSNPNPVDASSRWVAAASVAPHWRLILSGSDLLFGDNSLNSPLWSLRWEVVFSLGLPLFAAAALFTSRYWPFALIASWGVVFVGMVAGNDTLALLPLFFAGSVLAARVDAIHSWMAPRTRSVTPRIGGAIFLAGCLALLTIRWMVWTVMPAEQRLLTLADSLQFFGAVGLVAMAAFWAPCERLLCARPVQWLGRLSFSLYLVHVPVLIAVGAVMGRNHAVLTGIVSLAVSIVMAELFFLGIERPAHKFSRHIGTAAARMVAAGPGTGQSSDDCSSDRSSDAIRYTT